MIAHSDIFSLLRRSAGIAVRSARVDPLAGDASNRTYYRVRLEGGGGPASLILMELAEPEAFKASEEAVSASRQPILELPYINILGYLERCGAGVPRLFGYDADLGFLLLEDLGDVTLQDRLATIGEAEQETLYRQALDELIQIRRCGPPQDRADCIAFGRSFDVPLYMWEFDHFIEYGIEARSERPVPPSDRDAIRNMFREIAEALAKEPLGFTHRDYHSRNLMLHGGRIRVLDFQDALLGPAVYDLASLLRDSYVDLPDEFVDRWVEYYLRSGAAGEPSTVRADDFRRTFDRMGIQRNLKAAGRFVYIDRVKHKDRYLAYVAPTLAKVRRALARNPDLHRLQALLGRHVPELS